MSDLLSDVTWKGLEVQEEGNKLWRERDCIPPHFVLICGGWREGVESGGNVVVMLIENCRP